VLREGFHHGVTVLSENNSHITLSGVEINNRESLGNFMVSLMDATGLDLIWMNIDFPLPLQEKQSPFPLLETLNKYNPEVRILISLKQATVYTLRNIFQKINPHGILELVDCDQKTINAALKALIQQEVFYSKSILLLLHTFLQTFESLDNADFAILHELDKGTAVTALPQKVLLSHSTILTRRTNLKILFKLEGKTDSHLVQEAKRLGYI
jgi:DNA-binding NarL/FixJ family response regulator